MNPLLESRCKRLLLKYKRTGVPSLRDQLFELCAGYVIRYVKLSLKRHRRYESQSQVLSLSYEVFNVAVETYCLGLTIPLTMHLSNSAKAGVQKWVTQERRRVKNTVSIEEEMIDSDAIPDLVVNPAYAIEGYISLKDFRQFLPDLYRTVLDDALCSFDSARKFRQTKPINCPLSSHRYYEAKRVLQFVAEFFLRG